MKLLMMAEFELPPDIFRAGKATDKLEPHWLKFLEAANEAQAEFGLMLLSSRCDYVRPRPRDSKKANGSATPRQTRRTFTLPHAQLPVDETV